MNFCGFVGIKLQHSDDLSWMDSWFHGNTASNMEYIYSLSWMKFYGSAATSALTANPVAQNWLQVDCVKHPRPPRYNFAISIPDYSYSGYSYAEGFDQQCGLQQGDFAWKGGPEIRRNCHIEQNIKWLIQIQRNQDSVKA